MQFHSQSVFDYRIKQDLK